MASYSVWGKMFAKLILARIPLHGKTNLNKKVSRILAKCAVSVGGEWKCSVVLKLQFLLQSVCGVEINLQAVFI